MESKSPVYNLGMLFSLLFPSASPPPQRSLANIDEDCAYNDFIKLTKPIANPKDKDADQVTKTNEEIIWSRFNASNRTQKKISQEIILQIQSGKLKPNIVNFYNQYLSDVWKEKKDLLLFVMKKDQKILPKNLGKFKQYEPPLDFAFALSLALQVEGSYMGFDGLTLRGCKRKITDMAAAYRNQWSLICGGKLTAAGEPSASSSPIREELAEGRKLANVLFEKIKGRGRFRGYDQSKGKRITQIKDTVLSNGQEITLEEIVFPGKSEDAAHSVSLCGRGGSGKTHQFLTLIDGILNGIALSDVPGNTPIQRYSQTIPFYIELNKVTEQNENCVLYRLARDMRVDLSVLEPILRAVGPHAIIFADGMNEVTNGNLRESIFDAICDIREDFHTRIVISSRVDHSSLFNSRGRGSNQLFEKAEVQDLSEKQINNYFEMLRLPIRYQDIPYETRPLLETAQGLSMYAEMIQKNHSLQFTNLGTLLQSYCDSLMAIDRGNPSTDLSFEKFLTRIAYHMVRMGKFSITKSELKRIVNQADWDELDTNRKSSPIFTSRSANAYEFTHQNFRDYHAGVFLARVVTDLSEENLEDSLKRYLGNDDVTSNREILSLCSDFLTADDIQNAIDLLRNRFDNSDTFPLSVLIRLYGLVNGNDLSALNLDGFDLRQICLSEYKLYRRDETTGEVTSISLKNAQVSEDTFLQNTLQTASSTICSYTFNGKVYVTAFSKTNALIYDAAENTWKCVRNLPDNGWVKCSCFLELHDRPIVLLGCESGLISLFDLANHTVERFCDTGESCGIESIFCVPGKDSEPCLLFCNSEGTVFTLRLSAPQLDAPRTLLRFDLPHRNRLKLKCDKIGIRIASRLTVSHRHAYLCSDNEIWRCELPISENSNFEKVKELDPDILIKDIHYTDGVLFLNKCREISVMECDTLQEGSPWQVENADKLLYFSKLSPDIHENSVIVGVAAKNNDYSQLANFYRITARYHADDEQYACIGRAIPRGLQTLTTYSAAYFSVPQSEIPRLATVADDRSVQILTPDDENAVTIYHRGAYHGVHAIDIINERELLVAQYDGSVSYWKKGQKGWKCRDIFHIHNGWVWKTMFFREGETPYFLSCSYDGTLKCTNLKTGKSETLLLDRSHQAVLDFAPAFDYAGKLSSVYAITAQHIYLWHYGEIFSEELHPEANWAESSFRSMALLGTDKPYVTVNVKLSTGQSKSFVLSWSNGTFRREIELETECSFIRCIKTYNFSPYKLMAVGGDSRNKQYLAFYLLEQNRWEFYGHTVPDEEPSGTEISLAREPEYGMVNDLIVSDFETVKGKEQFSFSLDAVYKNEKAACFTVTVEKHHAQLTDRAYPCSWISSQPTCIVGGKSITVVGMLNGDVAVFDREREAAPIFFRTYANLNASVDVSLKSSDVGGEIQREIFEKNFAGYFSFDH